ncbi:MAG: DUF58 domain-containing protein [Planctomycetota bacterium]
MSFKTQDERTKASSPFLDVASLSGLESMRFSTKRRVDGHYSGRHVAQRHGGAGQFIDSREYAPGDDLRRLDWPAMGRTGRAYVRLYQDETNLACVLNVDASGSMHFGAASTTDPTGSKLQWVQYFATALSHLIVLGRDQVGLSVAVDEHSASRNLGGGVNDGDGSYAPPSASPRQVRRLHERIAALRAGGTSPLGASLQDLFLRVRRRAVLMVISDFLMQPLDDTLRALRQFRGRGWETIAVHVVHPLERALPNGIAYRFAGLEGEGHIDCRPAEIRATYQAKFSEHCQRVRDGLLGAGCDYRIFGTDQPYLDAIRCFMVPRTG